MITKEEALLKSGNEWLYYSGPKRVITATTVHDVRSALTEIEGLVNSNKWHAVGFVSYEAAPAFDRALQVLDAGGFPLLWFGLYPEPQPIQLPLPEESHADLNWQPSVRREVYNSAIQKIKNYIAEGKTYQVNYTMRLNAGFEGEAWTFFLKLAKSQNKYAAYIDTGRYVICSASPELFFHLEDDILMGRPMKGTAGRGRTTREDREQANWLFNSEKNRAENVMIVDMIRNDIGRVAVTGSVHVPELFAIEKYRTLFQMTSTVQGKTQAPITEIFAALFPCASITGAPKVRTMSIISELETTPRRIYTGSIGFISPNRKAQFNVAIRTALIDREHQVAEYSVGGGIVWDSTSADEYSEALLKARVLTESSQDFSLLETILWTPHEHFYLLDRHIARMADSAEYFGFQFNGEKLGSFLRALSSKYSCPMRLRVLSNNKGEFSVEEKEFSPEGGSFKVRLARDPVESDNFFLFHKTTHREMYEDALSHAGDCKDVLLFNEKGELTEFTMGNLVLEMNNELVTPPISCGLLAGTFRAHLLETGKIRERVVHSSELKHIKKIYLVNSVRKWMEVVIHDEGQPFD